MTEESEGTITKESEGTMRRLAGVVSVLGLAAFAACGKDAMSPGPALEWTRYASVAWEYRYAEPGYSEGLDSVQGALLFERSGDAVRVQSETNVVGWFWVVAGADTSRGAVLLWRPDRVLRGTVTPGDTFSFASANYDLWPAHGEYRLVGDTLFYEWAVTDSTFEFLLRVRYERGARR